MQKLEIMRGSCCSYSDCMHGHGIGRSSGEITEAYSYTLKLI